MNELKKILAALIAAFALAAVVLALTGRPAYAEDYDLLSIDSTGARETLKIVTATADDPTSVITVTMTGITATSGCMAMLNDAETTAVIKYVVPGTNSAVVTLSATPASTVTVSVMAFAP